MSESESANSRTKRKRTNANRACVNCRQRKKRCDGVTPTCGLCSSYREVCQWDHGVDWRKPVSREHIMQLRRHIEELEAQLANNSQSQGRKTDREVRHTRGASVSDVGPSIGVDSAIHGEQEQGHETLHAEEFVQGDQGLERGETSPRSSTPWAGSEDDEDIAPLVDHHDRIEGSVKRKPVASRNRSRRISTSIGTEVSSVMMRDQHGSLHFHGPSSAYRHAPAHAPQQPAMSSSLSPEQWTHIDTPFARYLPETALSREQHDTALNRFFRYFASWGNRVHSLLFRRDMDIAIRLSVGTPVKLSSAAPNYSPMLHNAILSLALAYSDEPHLRAVPTRRVYFQEAMRLQDDECVAPNIATIQALALLSSYQSTLGQFDLGWMYFGRAIRACYSMGLHIDTTLLVERDQLPRDLYIQRNNTFWTIFLQEEMWAIYIGRSPFMIEFSTPLPIADTVMDDIPWANVTANSFGSGNKEGSDGIGEQPSLLAATFSRAVGLMRIAHDITKTVYGIKVKGEVSFPLETIRGYHARLNSWLDDLPPTFQVDAGSSAAALPHVIMLHMAWAWIMILLLQPFCQQTSTKNAPPIDETQGEFTPLSGPAAMLSCHHAASRILDLSVLWEHQHDLRFVPPTMTHIVYLAGTTFLLVAARSGPAHASAHALDQAQKCLSTLHGIGQTWSAAFQKAAVLSDLLDDYGKLTRLTSQSRSQRASRSDISLDTQSQRCDTYPSGMTVTNLSTSTSLMGLDGGLRSGFDQLNPTISDLRFDVRDDIHPQSIGNAQPIPEHDVFGNNCLTDLSLDNTFDTSWSGGEFDEFISSVLSQMGPPPTNDWDLMTLLAQPQQSWQQ